MKLEILSFEKALKYIPKEKSYGLRIFDSIPQTPIWDLTKNNNWIKIDNFYFNDGWPKNWEEYFWVKDSDWDKLLKIERENYPKMTKESLIDYYESEGYPTGRGNLFEDNIARDIFRKYEKVKEDIEKVIIHCVQGIYRSPAIGKALNDIYGWDIKNLEKKFPVYRRYIYEKMMKIGKEFV